MLGLFVYHKYKQKNIMRTILPEKICNFASSNVKAKRPKGQKGRKGRKGIRDLKDFKDLRENSHLSHFSHFSHIGGG